MPSLKLSTAVFHVTNALQSRVDALLPGLFLLQWHSVSACSVPADIIYLWQLRLCSPPHDYRYRAEEVCMNAS